jgi:hypothetical protein
LRTFDFCCVQLKMFVRSLPCGRHWILLALPRYQIMYIDSTLMYIRGKEDLPGSAPATDGIRRYQNPGVPAGVRKLWRLAVASGYLLFRLIVGPPTEEPGPI